MPTIPLDPAKVAEVAQLPRRTAHALHGLLVASLELKMPVKAHEVQVYDGEAITAHQTAAGLVHARRLGLAMYTGTGSRLWVATEAAQGLRYAIEDRYLRETYEEERDA